MLFGDYWLPPPKPFPLHNRLAQVVQNSSKVSRIHIVSDIIVHTRIPLKELALWKHVLPVRVGLSAQVDEGKRKEIGF